MRHRITLTITCEAKEDLMRSMEATAEGITATVDLVRALGVSWRCFNQSFTLTNDDAPPNATRKLNGAIEHSYYYEEIDDEKDQANSRAGSLQ